MEKRLEKNQTVWRLRSEDGGTSADILPAWGGILSSLVVPSPSGPRELLYRHEFFWDPDTQKTRGGSPLLFPACGRLERNGESEAYLLDGRLHRLPIHGFSMRLPWEAMDSSREDTLSLRLMDSPRTRSMYPFSFELRMTHRVLHGELQCRHELRNTGTCPMPYSLGYHPYFATPAPGLGKEAVRVAFRARRRLRYNERLTDILGDAPACAFPAAITDPRINETIHEWDPGPGCRMTFPDGLAICVEAVGAEDPGYFKHMQLYTLPEAPFFCVEPWTSHPNALNSVDGARRLNPGGVESGRFRILASFSETNLAPAVGLEPTT